MLIVNIPWLAAGAEKWENWEKNNIVLIVASVTMVRMPTQD